MNREKFFDLFCIKYQHGFSPIKPPCEFGNNCYLIMFLSYLDKLSERENDNE